MTLQPEYYVQEVLDSVNEGETLKVTFIKSNGDIVTYRGTLDVGANRSDIVAIKTEEGWKKFRISNVIDIENEG